MNNSTSQRGLVLGLTGIMALLVLNAGLAYRKVRELNEEAGWVIHTHEVMDSLANGLAHLRQAEADQWDDLIAGDDALRPAVDGGIKAARLEAGRLRVLIGDDAEQRARAADLDRRIDGLVGLWARAAAARKERGFDAARQVMLAGRGRGMMADLRALFAAMDRAERTLLLRRRAASAGAYATAVATVFIGAATGLAAVGLAAALFGRDRRIRRRSEALIHEQRQLLQATLTSIGDAVIATDSAGRVTFMNRVAQDLTGWADGMGLPLEHVFHIVNEDSRQPVDNPALRALKQGTIVGLANHTVLIARDGTERPIDDSAAPIRDEAGTVSGAVLVFRDVTERRRTERTLQEQARLLDLANVLVRDLDDRIVLWNHGAELMYGWTRDEAQGRISHELLRTRFPRPLGEILADLHRDGHWRGRLDHVRRDGMPVVVASHWVIHRDRSGKPVAVLEVNHDITSEKRAEEEVRRSEARKAAILDTALDCIITIDHEGRIVEFNPAAERTFGHRRADVIGREMAGLLVPPALRQPHRDGLSRYLATGDGPVLHRRIELTALRSDGTEFPVELAIAPIAGDGPPLFTGYLRDITEREQAERNAAEQMRHARLNAEVGIALTGNESLRGILQACAESLVRNLDGAFARIWTLNETHDILELQASAGMYTHVDGPHGRIPVGQFKIGLIARERQPHLTNAVQGDPRVPEQEWARREGLVAFAGYPLIVNHRLVGVLGMFARRALSEATLSAMASIARGIALGIERKDMEDKLRQLVADLSEADRRKDEFLATLAHELRNPLAPIRNGLQLMRLSAGQMETIEQARSMMERQLAQLVRLVDDLMDVSRITRGKVELRKERVELAAVIRSAVETSRPLIEEMGHDLTVSLPDRPILVDADLTRLAQVFLNLLNNAAKYSDPGGQIRLTAEQHGDHVAVSVRDTGIGIAADQLPRIFGMFAQVDRAMERSQGGLGIGLTLVKRLVEMHGGRIEARSEGLGRGSEFLVRLPIAVDAPRPQADDNGRDEPAVPRSSLRILIVDDNRDGANSLAMMLRIMGNETRTAYDGEHGVDVAEEFRPDVALLDIGLPKLSGYEACRRIREQPGGERMVLIAVTGWGQEEDVRRSHEAGFDHHLVKPVDPNALMTLLARSQATTA